MEVQRWLDSMDVRQTDDDIWGTHIISGMDVFEIWGT